jgi:acetoin:2,6-dichlorophenolindophenol oxidoreductase subunit beta
VTRYQETTLMQNAVPCQDSSRGRRLSFAKAINEGLGQSLELCSDVLILGQMVDSKSGVFGTTAGLVERFGPDRVQDFPIAESLMTATGIGAAVCGLRPVLVHQRLDFMLYSLDAIVNWLSLWRFKSNGQMNLPVTIRAIVGRGWGQGPQHSKSLHAWFAHLPGLRVAMPATAYDAKGLLLESIFGENPTLIVEHRALFSMVDEVPCAPYRVRFGEAVVRRAGEDVTVVAAGPMVPAALRVAAQLAEESLYVEVVDPRTVSPLDTRTICDSVSRTRRLVVVDPAWRSVGFAAEVIAAVTEQLACRLLADPVRICLPDSHTPMSAPLEEQYYPNDERIAAAIRSVACRNGLSVAA